jgi:hypothetical protein
MLRLKAYTWIVYNLTRFASQVATPSKVDILLNCPFEQSFFKPRRFNNLQRENGLETHLAKIF